MGPKEPPEKLCLTLREAARMVGLSQRTLWSHLCPRGTLRPTRVGRRVLIARAELERWIAERATAAADDVQH